MSHSQGECVTFDGLSSSYHSAEGYVTFYFAAVRPIHDRIRNIKPWRKGRVLPLRTESILCNPSAASTLVAKSGVSACQRKVLV